MENDFTKRWWTVLKKLHHDEKKNEEEMVNSKFQNYKNIGYVKTLKLKRTILMIIL